MDVQAKTPVNGPTENLEIKETPFRPDIPEPPIDLQTDTFDIEPGKPTEHPDQVEVDFTRTFPSELSLEIHNHLEKAIQEVAHVMTAREKEREGVLEAEGKIRYKILEQDQLKGPFKKGYPVVKPRRVIVRRKRIIRPGRRIPKYLPTVDGKLWKVWGYPEFIELSTSSSEEVVEIPEGVELDQDGYPLLDPDTFDFTSLSPKWLRVLGKVVLYLLQSVTGFFMVKYAVKLWRSYAREVHLKHTNKPPNLSEYSDSDDSDNR